MTHVRTEREKSRGGRKSEKERKKERRTREEIDKERDR